jgi:hypothetical protein
MKGCKVWTTNLRWFKVDQEAHGQGQVGTWTNLGGCSWPNICPNIIPLQWRRNWYSYAKSGWS